MKKTILIASLIAVFVSVVTAGTFNVKTAKAYIDEGNDLYVRCTWLAEDQIFVVNDINVDAITFSVTDTATSEVRSFYSVELEYIDEAGTFTAFKWLTPGLEIIKYTPQQFKVLADNTSEYYTQWRCRTKNEMGAMEHSVSGFRIVNDPNKTIKENFQVEVNEQTHKYWTSVYDLELSPNQGSLYWALIKIKIN